MSDFIVHVFEGLKDTEFGLRASFARSTPDSLTGEYGYLMTKDDVEALKKNKSEAGFPTPQEDEALSAFDNPGEHNIIGVHFAPKIPGRT